MGTDAGLVMDPITGFGIGHALRDAELLSAAIVSGLGGTSDLNRALTRYEKQRNRETNPDFDWTLNLAHLRGVSEVEERLFAAIGADQAEASNFLGFLTGVVPMRSFFNPTHFVRWVGIKDFVRLTRARSRRTPPRPGGLDLSGDRSGTGSEGAKRRLGVE